MIAYGYTAPKSCPDCHERVCCCNLAIGICHFCKQLVMACDKDVSEWSQTIPGLRVEMYKCGECCEKADA